MSDQASAPAADPSSAPAPASPGKGGVDAMMAQLDSAVLQGKTIGKPSATPAAPKATATPAAPAAPAAPAKPAPAAPAAPQAAAPAGEGDEPDFSKAPPKWHKIYEDQKSKWTGKISEYEKKLRELESRPQSAANDKRIEEMQQQMTKVMDDYKKAQDQITELDYRRGPDFKKFVDRINSTYNEAISYVEQAQVKETVDGEVKMRQATKDDFDYIRALPAGPRRNQVARQMFGDEAGDILAYIKSMDGIKSDAERAVKEHSSTREQRLAQEEVASRENASKYQKQFDAEMAGLQGNKDWGKWFSNDEADPEGSQMFQTNLEEIDRLAASLDKMPMEEQARYAALFRSRAAGFPRLLSAYTRLQSEHAAVVAALAKARGVDPGEITAEKLTSAQGTSDPTPKKLGGIAGAAAAFDDV